MMHQRMYHHSQGNSFSMVFGHGQYRVAAAGYDEDEEEMYSFTTTSSSPSPSSVDCTLSLGTPSTRLTNDDVVMNTNIIHHQEKKRASCVGISNFGWNILPSSNHAQPPSAVKSNRAGNNNADPLLARRCANCDTTSTPLWRNGPRGPKSLCNACGIRFKKEERRATAAAAASTTGCGADDTQHMMTTSNWVQAQRMGCYSSAYGNEFRFMEEDDNDHHRDSSDSAAAPFLSWLFNVADRPAGLVHDFTR